jgi:hypothetical protein
MFCCLISYSYLLRGMLLLTELIAVQHVDKFCRSHMSLQCDWPVLRWYLSVLCSPERVLGSECPRPACRIRPRGGRVILYHETDPCVVHCPSFCLVAVTVFVLCPGMCLLTVGFAQFTRLLFWRLRPKAWITDCLLYHVKDKRIYLILLHGVLHLLGQTV